LKRGRGGRGTGLGVAKKKSLNCALSGVRETRKGLIKRGGFLKTSVRKKGEGSIEAGEGKLSSYGEERDLCTLEQSLYQKKA